MVGDDALTSNLALNAISLTAPSDMWRPAWKKPGNAVHCVIFQKADASSAGYSRSGFQCVLADKDFRRKPKAWRGTKLYAIASGFRRIGPNRLLILQTNPSIRL